MSFLSRDQSVESDFVLQALEKLVPGLIMDPACDMWGHRPAINDICPVPFGTFDAQHGQRVMGEAEFRRMVWARGYNRFGVACLYDFLQSSSRNEVPERLNGSILFFCGVWLLNPRNGLSFVVYTEKRVDPRSESLDWGLGVHCTCNPYWFSGSRVVG